MSNNLKPAIFKAKVIDESLLVEFWCPVMVDRSNISEFLFALDPEQTKEILGLRQRGMIWHSDIDEEEIEIRAAALQNTAFGISPSDDGQYKILRIGTDKFENSQEIPESRVWKLIRQFSEHGILEKLNYDADRNSLKIRLKNCNSISFINSLNRIQKYAKACNNELFFRADEILFLLSISPKALLQMSE